MKNADATGEICTRICEGILRAKMTYAAFERALGVPPKTVSNWRRGVSHSYLSMLPQIAHLLSTTTDDLLGNVEKGEEEWAREAECLHALFVKAKKLPPHRRVALYHTLEDVMKLYFEDA
jgi:transcriptional regulator with XRE-family HTH domain